LPQRTQKTRAEIATSEFGEEGASGAGVLRADRKSLPSCAGGEVVAGNDGNVATSWRRRGSDGTQERIRPVLTADGKRTSRRPELVAANLRAWQWKNARQRVGTSDASAAT